MSEIFTVACIKCGVSYKSTDPDPYYCEKCVEEKKKIALEVDKKLATRPKRQVRSELQIYDAVCNARGTQFASIKDLGIKL